MCKILLFGQINLEKQELLMLRLAYINDKVSFNFHDPASEARAFGLINWKINDPLRSASPLQIIRTTEHLRN